MPARRPRRNDALSAALGYFRDLGVRELHLAAPPAVGAPKSARRSAVPSSQPPSAEPPAVPLLPDLDALRASVAACELCGLCRTRSQTVFADGTGHSGVMFVGEAPGADEDATGVPFVGRAGQLLTKMIGAMGLDRADVYIANVL